MPKIARLFKRMLSSQKLVIAETICFSQAVLRELSYHNDILPANLVELVEDDEDCKEWPWLLRNWLMSISSDITANDQ